MCYKRLLCQCHCCMPSDSWPHTTYNNSIIKTLADWTPASSYLNSAAMRHTCQERCILQPQSAIQYIILPCNGKNTASLICSNPQSFSPFGSLLYDNVSFFFTMFSYRKVTGVQMVQTSFLKATSKQL